MVKSLIRLIEKRGDMAELTGNEQGMLWVLYQCLHNIFKKERMHDRRKAE